MLPEIVPETLAKSYLEQMKRPDLVFVTHENKMEMAIELAKRRALCEHDWEYIDTPAVGSHPAVTHIVCKICQLDKADLDLALKDMEARRDRK